MTQFKQRIEQGLSGEYTGLANGFERINKYIYNIQRGCYTLIGGLSGSSKTTLCDFIVLNGIQDAKAKGIPINVTYYSWEIDEFTKKANWLSVLIYNKYNRIISPQTIKGLGDSRLTPEELEIVNSELPELEDLFSKITWFWTPVNPTGLYHHWWTTMSKKGTFVTEPYIDENNEPKEKIISWKANNLNEYNLVVIDHALLAKLERGFTPKQNIDKMSEYIVACRNMFNMTFFMVQQFNQSLSNIDRVKFRGVSLEPEMGDFRDSVNPYIDADIVMGLLNPAKMQLETSLGYNINVEGFPYNLKYKYRLLKIIKNRLGQDNISIGLYTKPEAGYFEELPKAVDMTNEDYTRYLNK
jgi:hypothetical protein